MAIKNLDEKFLHGLGDIFDAEHRFLEAQRELLQQAQSSQLRTMIQEHIGQTEQQISNLEKAYDTLGEPAKRERCDGAVGLITEGRKVVQESEGNPKLRDTVIAGALDKVEHYEIASYRGLVTEAQQMGHDDVVGLLRENLQQEEQTAQRIEQSTPQLVQKLSGGTSGGMRPGM